MELLIVVAIIGVLTAVAIPRFAAALDRSRSAACAANRRSLLAAAAVAYLSGDGDTVRNLQKQYDGSKTGGEYTCPGGGRLTLTQNSETGAFTVTCSKHSGETTEEKPLSRTAAAQTTGNGLAEAYTAVKGAAYSTSTSARAYSSALSDAGSTAAQMYARMTDAQKSLLSGYEWAVVPYTNKSTKKVELRVYLADKTAVTSRGTFGVYKYNPGTGQFQYAAQTQNKDGSLNVFYSGAWGAYADGKFMVGIWADTMEAADGTG